MDRNKPILRGDIYCAPRCGLGCKHSDYVTVTRQANELCAVLGDGWLPRTWDNFGWNFSARKGDCEVYPRVNRREGGRIDGYTAYLNTPAKQFICDAKDPNDAVGFAVQDARGAMQTIKVSLASLRTPTQGDR